MFAWDKAKTAKQPFDAEKFGFEFTEEYLTARYGAFRRNRQPRFARFRARLKAKMRS